MKVLIDDERTFDYVDVILRNCTDARTFIKRHGKEITELFMDHDLGDKFGPMFDNGYKILTCLLEAGHRPNKVKLVTMNPVGRDQMGAALMNHGYLRRTPEFYTFD